MRNPKWFDLRINECDRASPMNDVGNCGLVAVVLILAAGRPNTTSILREFAARGALDSLERPNLSRYRDSVIRIYQSTGYRPVWLQGNRPTAQAKVIIAALERAESRDSIRKTTMAPPGVGG
jgi:hypothetical protein